MAGVMITPLKSVICCIGCNKSTKGHVRLMKNVALKSVYNDIFTGLLDLPSDIMLLNRIYICDSCISIALKFKDIKDTCKINTNQLQSQERQKRQTLNSVSPNINTKRLCLLETKKVRKGRKQLFMSPPHPSPDWSKENTTNLSDVQTPPVSFSDSVQIQTPSVSHSDHAYSSALGIVHSIEDIYKRHHPLHKQSKCLTDVDLIRQILFTNTTSTDDLVTKILTIPQLNEKIWKSFLVEISQDLDRLCSTKHRSVLRSKVDDISPMFLKNVVEEMDRRCPKVLDIFVSMCTPLHLRLSSNKFTVAVLYSMVMHSRNPQMCAFQKQLAAVCIRYNAGNGLLGVLGSLDLTISEKSKIPLLDELSRINGKGVIEALKNGRTIKITVDNIDGRIRANQIRLGSGNRDFHYTHWTVLVDRATQVDLAHLNQQPKVINADGPDPKHFFINDAEHKQLRSCYTWLIEKILVEELTSLAFIKIPDIFEYQYKDIVDRPSEVHPMFVIMKDPKSLPNCVLIMDKIKETLHAFYADAGRGEEFLNTATIPLGGDQLTRVCFESARRLRAGSHTRTERLQQFTPIIDELFHVEMDLLEKIIKKFYSAESCREVGTLSNLRAVLHRTNVNGQVKSSNGFEPHRDFVFTVARALLVELACELLQLEDKTSEIPLPQHIKSWTSTKKKEWLDNLVQPLVDKILRPYDFPSVQPVTLTVRQQGLLYKVTVPAEYIGRDLDVTINGEVVHIAVPGDTEKTYNDDLYNYSLSFLRVSMELMQLDDLIKSGDTDRLVLMLKRCIPLFVGLTSYRSKYAIECINFLTQTESMLSEYESVRVKLGAFVNTSGKAGHNKAADMQQENNIKEVKHVIRGLGAGKTDKAMERSSRAAPILTEMVSSLEASLGLRHKQTHAKKSLSEDLTLLYNRNRNLRPFQVVTGRILPTFPSCSSNVHRGVDKHKLCQFIQRHSSRTVTRIMMNNEESDDEDSDDEIIRNVNDEYNEN